MGCGSSAATKININSNSAKRHNIYQCHGTDYTNYSRLNLKYGDNYNEENISEDENDHHLSNFDSQLDYKGQQKVIWQEYKKQQEQYQRQQMILEKKRREKLRQELEKRITARKQQQQQQSQNNELQSPVKEAQVKSSQNPTANDSYREGLDDLEEKLNEIINSMAESNLQAGDPDGGRKLGEADGSRMYGYDEYYRWNEKFDRQRNANDDERGYETEIYLEVFDDGSGDIVEVNETPEDDELNDTGNDTGNPLTENDSQMGVESGKTLHKTAKTISMVKAITENWKSLVMTKKDEHRAQGDNLGDLQVTVLDTLNKDDLSFINMKPRVTPEKKYTDKDFNKQIALGGYAKSYQWKRPEEIYPDEAICLFHEAASINDVQQGVFGDCYFLAVLAGLANQSDVMKQIIPKDAYDPTVGVFHCRFWKFGHWIDIYIDDYLPSYADSRGLCGCKSNTYSGEMWIPLMEKAWAKFNGSYEAMESGAPSYAYLSLTGGTPELLYYKHKLNQGKFDENTVYKRVSNALKTGSLVVGNASTAEIIGQSLVRTGESLGLVMSHAYTLTAACHVTKRSGESFSLIRLRNPWASKEWTGPWSDTSRLWNAVPKSVSMKLKEEKENGEFWMEWNDFYKYFDSISICHFTPDYDADGISDGLVHVFCIYAQWNGELTGGWKEIDKNPKFEFDTPQGCNSWIVIELMEEKKGRNSQATGAMQIELCDVTPTNLRSEGEQVSTYTTSTHITRRFEIFENRTYEIIPSRYETGQKAKFLMRVFSKPKLNIRPLRVV